MPIYNGARVVSLLTRNGIEEARGQSASVSTRFAVGLRFNKHSPNLFSEPERATTRIVYSQDDQEGLLERFSRLRPLISTRTGALPATVLFGGRRADDDEHPYLTRDVNNRDSTAQSGVTLTRIDLSALSAKPKTDAKNNLKVLAEELSALESRIESLNSRPISNLQLEVTNARITTIQDAKDDWLKQERIISREIAIETLEALKTRIINELKEDRNRNLTELESRREEIKQQIDQLENSNAKTDNLSMKDDQSEPNESNQKASNSYYEEQAEEASNLTNETQSNDFISDLTTALSGETSYEPT